MESKITKRVDKMRIVAKYEVKNAERILKEKYLNEFKEIIEIVKIIDATKCLDKVSKEKTKKGRMLFSPISLNKAFKEEFLKRGWKPVKIKCKYPDFFYLEGYRPPRSIENAYREMDFVKNKVGVEVQFGKYAFMVYNVSAKMTIFHNLGYIDIGVEIVPVKEMQINMSTGVSFFEQLVWDLKHRGVADIDIPVLILGIAP